MENFMVWYRTYIDEVNNFSMRLPRSTSARFSTICLATLLCKGQQ